MFEGISLFFALIVWYEIIALAIVSILMVGFMWNEHGAVPFVGLLIIMFYSWTGNGALVEPVSLLDAWLFILGYIVIGLIWSVFKWGRLVKYYINKYEKEADVRSSLSYTSNDKIAFWILWWPFSILGFIFDDAIEWIIEHFKGVYNMITEKMISSAISTNSIEKEKEYDDYHESNSGSDMDNYFAKKKKRNQ